MGRFKITEEQYNAAIAEGITLTADINATNGDVARAVDIAKNQAVKSGVDLSKAKIEIPATNETKMKANRQVAERKFRLAKENAKYYTVRDFIKQCNK